MPIPLKRSPSTDDESETLVTPKSSPGKKAKTTPGLGKKQGEAWTYERRNRLFDAVMEVSNIKWDEVAQKLGDGSTGKMCREQWQMVMTKRMKGSLGEK